MNPPAKLITLKPGKHYRFAVITRQVNPNKVRKLFAALGVFPSRVEFVCPVAIYYQYYIWMTADQVGLVRKRWDRLKHLDIRSMWGDRYNG